MKQIGLLLLVLWSTQSGAATSEIRLPKDSDKVKVYSIFSLKNVTVFCESTSAIAALEGALALAEATMNDLINSSVPRIDLYYRTNPTTPEITAHAMTSSGNIRVRFVTNLYNSQKSGGGNKMPVAELFIQDSNKCSVVQKTTPDLIK